MAICEDLKIGGTVGPTGIADGTSVSNHALMVFDYSSLWGTVSKRASAQRSIGTPGGVITGQELPDSRLILLNLRSTDLTAIGGGGTPSELWANQDTLTSLFTDTGGEVIEWILPTESRWIKAYGLTAASVFIAGKYRTISLPLTAPWPYWQSDTEQSQVIDGTSAYTIGGTTQRIYLSLIHI